VALQAKRSKLVHMLVMVPAGTIMRLDNSFPLNPFKQASAAELFGCRGRALCRDLSGHLLSSAGQTSWPRHQPLHALWPCLLGEARGTVWLLKPPPGLQGGPAWHMHRRRHCRCAEACCQKGHNHSQRASHHQVAVCSATCFGRLQALASCSSRQMSGSLLAEARKRGPCALATNHYS
jgi:hypothetical protein